MRGNWPEVTERRPVRSWAAWRFWSWSRVLTRALEPFPTPVRTLDALHLASTEFLRERQPAIRLATYDSRPAAAAKAMGIALYDLEAGGK
jgi:hypothetical protein